MKLLERIDRKPVAIAFGLRRGGGGQGDGSVALSVTRDADSVSLVTPSGATPLQSATPSVAGVLGAADKAKLDKMTEGLATPSADGLMAGDDKAKLDGIEPGATADQTGAEMVDAIDTHLGSDAWRQVGAGASNLTVTRDAGSVTVLNDGGSDAVLPAASNSAAGIMTAADKTKLDGLSTALATPASDGLMSGADKAKLDALSAAQPAAAIEFVIDGGGSAIAPGLKGFVQVPMNCTIMAARLLADRPGSIVVDVWKDSYANYPPADADSITAAAPLTLGGAIKSEDTGLAGWTKGVAAGDVLGFNVDSASAVTRVTVVLLVSIA